MLCILLFQASSVSDNEEVCQSMSKVKINEEDEDSEDSEDNSSGQNIIHPEKKIFYQ